jgi:hypothetical protein
MTSFTARSHYYLVQACNTTDYINVRWSTDGVNWKEWKQVQGAKSKAAPAMLSYRGKLYIAYINSSKKVNVSYSSDLENWTPWCD